MIKLWHNCTKCSISLVQLINPPDILDKSKNFLLAKSMCNFLNPDSVKINYQNERNSNLLGYLWIHTESSTELFLLVFEGRRNWFINTWLPQFCWENIGLEWQILRNLTTYETLTKICSVTFELYFKHVWNWDF